MESGVNLPSTRDEPPTGFFIFFLLFHVDVDVYVDGRTKKKPWHPLTPTLANRSPGGWTQSRGAERDTVAWPDLFWGNREWLAVAQIPVSVWDLSGRNGSVMSFIHALVLPSAPTLVHKIEIKIRWAIKCQAACVCWMTHLKKKKKEKKRKEGWESAPRLLISAASFHSVLSAAY